LDDLEFVAMPRTLTFKTARHIVSALPGVEKRIIYGTPALKVLGTLTACVPSHRSAEPGSLVV
jgi:hypothetical protein